VALGLFGWEPLFGAKIRPLSRLKFEPTPARLERGAYLVQAVARCPYCHSELNWDLPGAPAKPETILAGRLWTQEGFSWLVSPNITPDQETGAGRWTDDMLARAIREGIGHDGRALLPTMPYQYFRRMSDEDLASVIVYIRSVTPVYNVLPKTKIPFPISRLILSAPNPVSNPVPGPDLSSTILRGAYLVQMSACGACHTVQDDQGKPTNELAFAGGFIFQTPLGVLASANITPHPSGISDYDEAMFLRVIRTGHVGARKLNPEMPWGYFRYMTDEDLRAIFSYLKTLNPIKHAVDNTEPPTYCKLCKRVHGFGERNQ
jgi:cytochrome c